MTSLHFFSIDTAGDHAHAHSCAIKNAFDSGGHIDMRVTVKIYKLCTLTDLYRGISSLTFVYGILKRHVVLMVLRHIS